MSSSLDDGLLPPEQIPGPPKLGFLEGVLLALRVKRDPLGYLRELRATYGNLVRLTPRRGKSMYFAFGPEYNALLHGDTELFIAKGFAIAGPPDTAQRRLATSLFSLNGEKHKIARRQLLPAFQKSAMEGYRADLIALLEERLAEWQPGQSVDLLHEMRRWSWSIAAKLLYGLDPSLASERLREDMDHWLHFNTSPFVRLLQKDWPLTPYRRLLRHAEHLEREILTLYRDRAGSGGTGNDVLSLLKRERADDVKSIDEEEIVGHVMTLFLAAFETTANTLTWTFFLLAQHPHIQAELLDELAPLHGAAPSLEELARLPVLDGVLKESLRLMPVIPASRRISSQTCAFGAYRLPAESRVYFSHYLTHHLPELYPEPERFHPARWQTISPSGSEYLPFGAGAHHCIGASFARLIVKTALAMTLPRWRFTVRANARIDRHVIVAMEPKHGMPMTVEPQDRQFRVAEVRGDIHEMVDLRRTAIDPPQAMR